MPEVTPPTSAGAEPSRRLRLVVLAVATVVAALLAETTLRIGFPEIGKLRRLVVATDDDRGFAPRPGIRIPFDGVFMRLPHEIMWQTNTQGFRRDGEVSPEPDRFRIATYGDSETFGWSVELDETFQRRMEEIDPRVEVLNFGVPGFNVTNVREQIETTVPQFNPDRVIYLVNKNDFNEPVRLTPLSYSYLLLQLRFAWHFTVGKKLRLMTRDRADHIETFAREVERMTRFLEARGIPFVVAFLKWKNHSALWTGRDAPHHAGRTLVDVQRVVAHEPRLDGHYAGSAHRRMAALFCETLSGASDRCLPSGWSRPSLAAGATAALVSHAR